MVIQHINEDRAVQLLVPRGDIEDVKAMHCLVVLSMRWRHKIAADGARSV